MNEEYTEYSLKIKKELLDIVKSYVYETKFDEISYSDIDDFIIQAIVYFYNEQENKITSGEIDEDGFTDGHSFTEHYIGIV